MSVFIKRYSYLLLLAYTVFVSVYALMIRTAVRLNGSRMYWTSQGLSRYCILACIAFILIIWFLVSANKKFSHNGVVGLVLLFIGLVLKAYLNWHFDKVGRWWVIPLDISTAMVYIGSTISIVNSLIHTRLLYGNNIHFATGVMILAVVAGIVFHSVWVPGYFEDEVGSLGVAISMVIPILPLLPFSSIINKLDKMYEENPSQGNFKMLYSRDFLLVSAILIIATISAFVLNLYFFLEARLSAAADSPAPGIISALITISVLLCVADKWKYRVGSLVLIGCGIYLLSIILLFLGVKVYALSFILGGASIILILEQCASFTLKRFGEPGAYGLWLIAIVVIPLTRLIWHKLNSLVLAFGNEASVFFLLSLLLLIFAYLFRISQQHEYGNKAD